MHSAQGLFGYPFAKVMRRELFQDIQFPAGVAFEDTILAALVYRRADRIGTISDMVYTYHFSLSGTDRKNSNNEKCIHTYFITKSMLQFQNEYQILKNESDYDYFLSQIRINHRRLKSMGSEVQEAAFILSAQMLREYFDGCKAYDRELEEIVKMGQYRRFRGYCCLR